MKKILGISAFYHDAAAAMRLRARRAAVEVFDRRKQVDFLHETLATFQP